MKIVSGGQNGVDQAALRAAEKAGLKTGGWAPKGYRTLDGPRPHLAEYGVKEHPSPNYPNRTYANVKDSEATLQLVSAKAVFSPGEICTRKAIARYGRPSLEVVVMFSLEGLRVSHTPWEVYEWLSCFSIVNVAGNSEKTVPGIGEWAEEFLRQVFEFL